MLIYIEAPVASFPRKLAREYKETYLYPPIPTVYGCLLSLIGELDKNLYSVDELRLGALYTPCVSRVLRRQRNYYYGVAGPGGGQREKEYGVGVYPAVLYSRPNYQEILTNVRIVVEVKNPEFCARITQGFKGVERFGILSLGESSSMVNCIREYRESDGIIKWIKRC
jgi:CRISPR-associated protein Cas5t